MQETTITTGKDNGPSPWASTSRSRSHGTMMRHQMGRQFWRPNSGKECMGCESNRSMKTFSHPIDHRSHRSNLILTMPMNLETIKGIIKQTEGRHSSTHRGHTANIKVMRRRQTSGMNLMIERTTGDRASILRFILSHKIEKPAQTSELIQWLIDQSRAHQKGNCPRMPSWPWPQDIRQSGRNICRKWLK